jgi:putative hydrolase of the HAD superfamily
MDVIIFDLDDTLYDEKTFVKSGHKAVSSFLSPILQVDQEKIFCALQEELANGREGLFDRVVGRYKKDNKKLVKQCLAVYRAHTPEIVLSDDAKMCLEQLEDKSVYVVTDGNVLVQRRKCVALGLREKVKKCLCSWAYGRKYSKPSPYCFEKICRWENISPSQAVYIADNPHKDFVGIKPLGFHTIRLLAGPYAKDKVAPEYEAEQSVLHLSDILAWI